MSEKKLEEIMSKDKSLVRRVSDIEVEEVTLTTKGALGDEADAVILYKEDNEETKEEEVADLEKEATAEETAEETTEEAAEEVVELEKEEVAEEAKDGNIEMDFDSAISFIQKGELTDDQKQSVLDAALVMFDAADLEKEQPVTESFPEEAMQLLKSIHESIEQRLPAVADSKEEPVEEKAADLEKDLDDEAASIDDKEDKTDFLKKEVSVIDDVDRLLQDAKEIKLKKQRSEQEAAVNKKLDEMSSVLSGLTEKFTETQRRLARECGIDA